MAIREIYNYYRHGSCHLSICQVWKKYDCCIVPNGKNGILLKFVTFLFTWRHSGSGYLNSVSSVGFWEQMQPGIFTLRSQFCRNFTVVASVYSSNHCKYKILGIHNICWYLDEGIFWKARFITTAVLKRINLKPM